MSSAMPASTAHVTVGQEPFRYRAIAGWEQLPPGYAFGEVAGIAIDSQGQVLIFNRSEHPVIVFDRAGNFLRSWGEGQFVRPHGITIGPDDAIYCVDDLDHTVKKFDPDGRLVFTLGTSGRAADTGAVGVDYRTIRRAAGPFNCPTNLALAANGELFIADGYGNARVHCFSPDGKLLRSWGEPGAGPGQFHVPHGIAVDLQGNVIVADRENSRLQRFTPEGEYLDQWTDVARPCQVTIDAMGNVFVAELGFRAGMFPGNVARPDQTTGGRVSIFDSSGRLLSRFGGGDNPCAAGDFFAPHDLAIDRHGDFYLGEVVQSAGGNRGLVDPACHSLQKFARVLETESP